MTGAAMAAGPTRVSALGPVANDLKHLGSTATSDSDCCSQNHLPLILVQRKIASSAIVAVEERTHFLGAVLRLSSSGDADAAGDLYEVVLRRRPEFKGQDVLVGRYEDVDAIAAWQAAAQAFQLPLVAEREDGTLVILQEKIGGVKLGAVRIRRRTASVARRRPRFLMRRKPAALPIRPVVHRVR